MSCITASFTMIIDKHGSSQAHLPVTNRAGHKYAVVGSIQILGPDAHAAESVLQLIGVRHQASVVETLPLSLPIADSIEELQQDWLVDDP